MNNDLISREDLKKAFEDTVCIEPMPYAFVKQIIDNAPTVEPTFGLFKEMLCSECEKRHQYGCSYASKQRAYKEGKYDGFMESPYGD